MKSAYRRDLAYIHSAGFHQFAESAAPGLLSLLRRNGLGSGLVVDLGCGPGHWAQRLLQAGYGVLGIDISASMIALARQRAKGATFRIQSLFEAEIPPCAAVTALGECVNYTFDPRGGPGALRHLFRRVFRALHPGGVFVFDAAGPDRAVLAVKRNWTEGEDWAVLVESEAGRANRTLTRRIVCFRRVGARYRRSEETHRMRLYAPEQILADLCRAGFEAQTMSGYGKAPMIPGVVAFLARKPR